MSEDPKTIVEEILRRRSRRCDEIDLSSQTPLLDVVDSLGLITVILDLELRLGGPVLDVTKAGSLFTVGDLMKAVRERARP